MVNNVLKVLIYMNKLFRPLFYLMIVFLVASCSFSKEKFVSGRLVMGHEVRAFVENGQNKEYWIIDKSGCLYKQYSQIVPIEKGSCIPVNAELKVKELPKMEEGFGAEYDGAYEVIEIISLYPIKQ